MSAKSDALRRLLGKAPEAEHALAEAVPLAHAVETPGIGSKVMNVLSAPQRYVMNKAANAIGVTGNPSNSEESAQNIVEYGAQTLGIPDDSAVGNAAKAASVAGLEMFADPIGALPFGKVAKGLEAVPKIEKFQALKKMFQVGDKIFPAEHAAEALKIKDALEKAGQVLPNRTLTQIK